MNELYFKQVLDSDGGVKHLEIWQGDQHVTISLMVKFAGGEHSYVWDNLKKTVNGIQQKVQSDSHVKLDAPSKTDPLTQTNNPALNHILATVYADDEKGA